MKKITNQLTSSLTLRIVFIIAAVMSITIIIYNTILINQSSRIFSDVLLTEVGPLSANECVDQIGCFESDQLTDNFIPPNLETGVSSIQNLDDIASIEAAANDQLRSALLREFLFIPIFVAALSGIVIARVVTKPQRQLNSAIQKLIDTGEYTHLEELDIAELDTTITQFNRLMDELKENETLRRHMISDISHELRTPLTSVTAMLHGMTDGVIPKTKKQLAYIQTELDKLRVTVDQFEEYITQQKDLVQINKEAVELRSFCQQNLGHLIDHAGLKLNLNISEDFCINADKKLLNQLLTNLTHNTIKYANASAISISADSAEITFSDDGIGVSSKHLRHLFERFYRVEKSRNKQHGGLGLGLSIVRQITERHGWTIAVESKNNKGLKYIIEVQPDSALFERKQKTKKIIMQKFNEKYSK